MTLSELRGKRVVILGLGKNKQGSGVGAAKWCIRHGMRVLITDMLTRKDIPLTIHEVEKAYASYRARGLKVFKPVFILGEHREADIVACDMVVQNPDVKFDSPFLLLAAKHGKMIETDLSLFFRFCPFPTIGITGTRGKTTTTMLLGAIMKLHDSRAVLGGNMRVSPLESLDKVLKAKRAMPIVLEISSWQAEALDRSGFSPHIAAITNLSEDHLNRYGTMEKYAAAKFALFAHQSANDIGIFNHDDSFARKMRLECKAGKACTAMSDSFEGDGVFWRGTQLISRLQGREEQILERKDLRLEGEHNLSNVAMAVALANAYGVSHAVIKRGVRSFTGVEHRQEILRVWKGITFVNDTTATSPDGLRAALKRFSAKPIVLLGGGTDKALTLAPLAPEIARGTKFAVLFKGTATDKLLAAWPEGDAHESMKTLKHENIKIHSPALAGSMKEAFALAVSQAKRGDVVLLSPGAASFGIFKNEFDRGEQFVKLVRALK